MFLEKLSNASGASGYEGEVRDIIKEVIKDYVDEIKVDRMGNIIAHKRGTGKRVIIDAHMDEVGFIITAYNEDGTLKFSPLGGINSKIIPSKVVSVGENKITGIIGIKPIHLQSVEERRESISYSECSIDIGSNSKEETKRLIDLGDFVVFTTSFSDFGKGLMKGKAFDDRVGCDVLISILMENYNCDLYGVFNVQEEVGERGAYASAYGIKPDIGIALEGTICADMPSVPKHLSATEIGKGPAVSIMDNTSIFNGTISQEIIRVAEENKIEYQLRRAVAGGNDAGAIHMSCVGATVATVSVPCRYIHSSISVASKSDLENTKKLMIKYLKQI